MASESDTTEGTPAEGTKPAEAAPDGSTTPTPDPKPTDTPDTGDTADLGEKGQKALAEERKARKAAEKAARDLETRLKAIEEKDLSEAEKVSRERDELKTRYEDLAREVHRSRAEKAITVAARKAGADGDNLTLVTELIDPDEYDEDADNAEALVKARKARYPHLFRPLAGPVETGAGKGAAPSSSKAQMGAWLRGS